MTKILLTSLTDSDCCVSVSIILNLICLRFSITAERVATRLSRWVLTSSGCNINIITTLEQYEDVLNTYQCIIFSGCKNTQHHLRQVFTESYSQPIHSPITTVKKTKYKNPQNWLKNSAIILWIYYNSSYTVLYQCWDNINARDNGIQMLIFQVLKLYTLQ